MSGAIALIATLDTKGGEVKYLKHRIEEKGGTVHIIDTGMRGAPQAVRADVSREEVAAAAGSSLAEVEKLERGHAIEVMRRGLVKVMIAQYEGGAIAGALAIGGQDGALLAAHALQALPLGLPKMIVTPIAQGSEPFGPYVGTSDIIIMHSVIDILGVNAISEKIFDQAAGAMLGALDMRISIDLKPAKTIAATMYGNTTPVMMVAKDRLERLGYEVIIFHPNGTGGRAMEEMIERGLFSAILDMTTHEVTDELFGGFHAGGPERLEVAGRHGVPQLVVPGCVDFIIQGARGDLPDKYARRQTYYFNPEVILVRLSPEEMQQVGTVMADKLNKAEGPAGVLIPLGGFSAYAHPGGALYDEAGDRRFIDSLKNHLRPGIPVVEFDAHINDPAFAEKAVSMLVEIMPAE